MFVSSPSEQRLVLGVDFIGNKHDVPDVIISVFSLNHFRGDNPSNHMSGYVACGCQCPLTTYRNTTEGFENDGETWKSFQKILHLFKHHVAPDSSQEHN